METQHDLYSLTAFLRGKSNEVFEHIGTRSQDKSFMLKSSLSLESNPQSHIPLDIKKSNYGPVELCIMLRKSVREFKNKQLSYKMLSNILHFSYGMNGRKSPSHTTLNVSLPHRNAPSAGALYPIKIYFYANNVQNLPKGLYYYSPTQNSIYLIKEGNFGKEIKQVSANDAFVDNCSIYLFFTALHEKTISKYGDRGWRFIFFDAGHIAQNFYLICQNYGLGYLALGGGFDFEINKFLGINKNEELYVYGGVIGYEEKSTDKNSEKEN